MTGLILDMKVLNELIGKYLPKVSAKLCEINMEPVLYAVQWFICLLSYNFPVQIVMRIWDIYFIEGLVFIFKIALAILKISWKGIKKLADFNEAIQFFGRLTEGIDDTDLILETASMFDVSLEEISLLRERFNGCTMDCMNFERYCSDDNECKKIQRMTSQYLTFSVNENIQVLDNFFDGDAVREMNASKIDWDDGNLMVASRNHYCRKETPKEKVTDKIVNLEKKYKSHIIMPRISLSAFFLSSESNRSSLISMNSIN